ASTVLADDPAPKGGAIQLVYRFTAGQDVRFNVKQNAQITVQSGSTTETTKNESIIDRRFRVASVDADGAAILELYIDKAVLSNTFNDDPPRTFDSSSKDPVPPGFESIHQSIGKQLGTMRISKLGKM